MGIVLSDDDRLCWCGCARAEHDEHGCRYCSACLEFSEDVDATLERLEREIEAGLDQDGEA